MRVEIGGWAGGGRCVARAEGKVWFVAKAIPGETIEAEPTHRRAGIVEARAVAVVRGSAMREAQPCPVAGTCGGCDLAHVRRDAIAEVLRAIVAGALRHAPPVLAESVARADVVVSPMGWRLRARLHWDADSGRLGFFAERSHEVIDIQPCGVVSPRLHSALPDLANALRAAGAPSGDLEWLEDLVGKTAVAGWWGDESIDLAACAGLDGFRVLGSAGTERGWGGGGVVMTLPVPLWVPVGAFFQGNRHLVPALFRRAASLIRESGPERVVDLYGGVGFLGAAASHAGVGDITVVETDARAAAAARANLPGDRVIEAPCETFLADPPPGRGSLTIVDPPRSGLGDAARRRLVTWAPDRIIFLACDPSRFGRDARVLLGSGYDLESLEIWDLFAGSHHAEILATFTRSRS